MNWYKYEKDRIIETFDGDYKLVFREGPLSCSVAGGTTYQIKNKEGHTQGLYIPPGWFMEKIGDV